MINDYNGAKLPRDAHYSSSKLNHNTHCLKATTRQAAYTSVHQRTSAYIRVHQLHQRTSAAQQRTISTDIKNRI